MLPVSHHHDNNKSRMMGLQEKNGNGSGNSSSNTVTSYLGGRLSWISRRGATIFLGAFISAIFVFFLTPYAPETRLQYVKGFASLESELLHEPPECGDRQSVASLDIWNRAIRKYQGLKNDKFTIAIQTYRRPKSLNGTLSLLTGTHIPSLEEIVIIWNDLENTPPADWTSAHNVTVRYRMSRQNSLNEKLWPDPAFRTQAVLLSDDDVHYEPEDLDFVFQTWRKHGQNRLTGAFARCTGVNKETGKWGYSLCRGRDSYSMVLTGLTFSHIAFLDYYSSDDTIMKRIRKFVDDNFNCEDIALNYVASMLTCTGPLQVSGMKKPTNEMPAKGISTKPGHMTARNQCLNDFVDYFGYMPLKNTTEYIRRGMTVG